MLVQETNLAEWNAIARFGRMLVLSNDILEDLLLFGSITQFEPARRETMLALAYQLDFIRDADWPAFRQVLARNSNDGDRRSLIARSVGMHICGNQGKQKQSNIDNLRSLWSSETVPTIKIALGQALEKAALCSLINIGAISSAGPQDKTVHGSDSISQFMLHHVGRYFFIPKRNPCGIGTDRSGRYVSSRQWGKFPFPGIWVPRPCSAISPPAAAAGSRNPPG